MSDIGRIGPGFWEGENARILNVPVTCFMLPDGEELEVVSIYVDEGYLCLDVKEKSEEG